MVEAEEEKAGQEKEVNKLTESVLKYFGSEHEVIKVRMRSGKDVYGFVRKVEEAHRKAGNSRLLFS